MSKPITNLAQLEALLADVLPGANIEFDNEDQIIIYTNLILIENNGDVQDRDELDEVLANDDNHQDCRVNFDDGSWICYTHGVRTDPK